MGCAASTQAMSDGAAAAPAPADRDGLESRHARRSTMAGLVNFPRSSERHSVVGSGGPQRTRRSSNGLFRRVSGGSSVASDDATASLADVDTLALGSNTQVVSAPSQWLVVMGSKVSGKSTLIRQLKMTYDGADGLDALRFTREARKVALDLIKRAAKEVAPSLADADAKNAAERIQALGRRAQVTESVASDVHQLWESPQIAKYESQLTDVQSRKACRHYVERIDTLARDDYIPEPADLMYMATPTVGQQETRVPSFPGGELTLVEINRDASVNLDINTPVRAAPLDHSAPRQDETCGQRRSHCFLLTQATASNTDLNILGPGLRGVVFVASLLEYQPSEKEAGFTLPPDVLKMWRNAQNLADSRNTPCFLVLSRRDLLYELTGQLPNGLTPSSFEVEMRSQFLGHVQSDEGLTQDNDARMTRVTAANTLLRSTLLLDLVNVQEGITPFIELMMNNAFPELDFEEDDSNTLVDSVHLCFAFFGREGHALSKGGVLPVTKWQDHVLSLSDHVWLHGLPQPLPNPSRVTDEVAALLGKGHPNEARAHFWQALTFLADEVGLNTVDHLGYLHIAPLLTSNGALMVVLRRDFGAAPALGPLKRGVKWQPVSSVAWKLAKVAQAAELHTYRQEGRTTSSSYAADVKEMIADTPSRDMQPRVWIEKLRVATGLDAPKMMSAGTYMVAFYTNSSREGLHVLIPANEHPSMVPFVKISDSHLSLSEWTQLRELAEGMDGGKSASVPKNWAAAQNWMGPEVGSEKQFTALQKFFYGVSSLRQRLERQCTAMKDEMRYSKMGAAAQWLATLGNLYVQEIVHADPEGKVQFIVIGKHFNDSDATDAGIPTSMRWTPISIFEEEHFRRFVPQMHNAVSTGRDVLVKALDKQQKLERCYLRNDLRASAAPSQTGSDAMHQSGLHDSNQASMLASAVQGEQGNRTSKGGLKTGLSMLVKSPMFLQGVFGKDDETELDKAWEALRWTKRVTNTFCVVDFGSTNAKPAMVSLAASAPKQRLQYHAKLYNTTTKALDGKIKQMKKRVETVNKLLIDAPKNASVGSAPTA